MANAAAKKAAAGKSPFICHLAVSILSLLIRLSDLFNFIHFLARKNAATTYKPILLGINALYVLLRAAHWQQAVQAWQLVGSITLWILQYVSYQGILDDASTFSSNNNNNSEALAGGKYLDLLGLTVAIQFGTALWSNKFYWLLCILPPVALWTLYSTLKGSMPGSSDGNGTKQDAAAPSESEEVTNRRQKRADRRRQKWS
jgi:hypothetical protein